MKRKRFSEEQIIRILKEGDAVGNVREVCRQHNITVQTFYRWRSKYGGMEVSDAKKLKGLEKENAERKKLVAELTLDNRMLKDVVAKKWYALPAKDIILNAFKSPIKAVGDEHAVFLG